jgi:hypothetical protein
VAAIAVVRLPSRIERAADPRLTPLAPRNARRAIADRNRSAALL